MKNKKLFLVLGSVLTVLFFTSCVFISPKNDKKDDSTNQTGTTDTTTPDDSSGEIEMEDYAFKISNFPYDSLGFVIKIESNIKDKNYHSKKEVGTITSTAGDAFITKTLQFPKQYDTMYIDFYDDAGKLRYFKPINKSTAFNEETKVYELKGYYYYYYSDNDTTKPYAATCVNEIINLEFEKEYKFNGRNVPYLIFHASDVRDKLIKFSKTDVNNSDLYIAATEEDIMTYQGTKYTKDTYKCTGKEVYFMIRAADYDNEKEGFAKCNITFSDITKEIENALEIDKAILASDGMIYASGSSSAEHSKAFLWKINPSTGEKTKITNFYNDIIAIKELEAGTLYVSHDSSISTVNLETGAVSTLVSDLTNYAEAFVNYKDNKLVITGQKTGSSAGQIVLVDKTTGNWKAVDYYHYYVSHGNVDNGTELFYISDYDLFISNTSKISPRDISFMKFASDDMEAPKYYSSDSQYHGDYNMNGPTKIISTSPLQVLTAGGCVFTINTDLLAAEDYTQVDGYLNKVRAWAAIEGTSFRSYDDCIFTNDYVYYMNTDKTENKCSVLKCALTSPKQVVEEEVYTKEKGIQFYSVGNKIYLLTNGTEVIYTENSYKDYKVYLHEIDF